MRRNGCGFLYSALKCFLMEPKREQGLIVTKGKQVGRTKPDGWMDISQEVHTPFNTKKQHCFLNVESLWGFGSEKSAHRRDNLMAWCVKKLPTADRKRSKTQEWCREKPVLEAKAQVSQVGGRELDPRRESKRCFLSVEKVTAMDTSGAEVDCWDPRWKQSSWTGAQKTL